MRNYNIGIGILTVIVIIAVVRGFFISGSPFEQKARNGDTQIVNLMSSLKYSIDSYYEKAGTLPARLEDLTDTNFSANPLSKKISYSIKTPTSYDLCADFATDTKSASSRYGGSSGNYVAGTTFYHAKGKDCISLSVYSYKAANQPTIKPEAQNTTTYFGTVDSVAVSDDSPRMIIKDNQVTRVFNLVDTKVVNRKDETISYTTFEVGDKVIIDAVSGSTYNNQKAVRVQNLSR